MKTSRKIEPGLYETDEGHRLESLEHQTGVYQDGWLLTYPGEQEPVDTVFATKAEALRSLGDDAPSSAPSDWVLWTCTGKNCNYTISQPPGITSVSHYCSPAKSEPTDLRRDEGFDLI